jgi:hypothetical protein
MGKLIGMLNLPPDSSSWPSWDEANRQFKREYLTQVLGHANGNQCLAAHLLGIHRNTLCRLCVQTGVNVKALRTKNKRCYRPGNPAPLTFHRPSSAVSAGGANHGTP